MCQFMKYFEATQRLDLTHILIIAAIKILQDPAFKKSIRPFNKREVQLQTSCQI